MAKKRLLLGLILCALAGLPLEAATVSFLVIETGLPQELGESRHSGLWESGLLDVFFEAGHIVSNAPILRLSRKPLQEFPDEAQEELAEAVEGGADYFIVALLEYQAPLGKDIEKPLNVSLRLFKTSPYKMIHEQQFADKSSKTLNDEYDNLKKAVRGLVPRLAGR